MKLPSFIEELQHLLMSRPLDLDEDTIRYLKELESKAYKELKRESTRENHSADPPTTSKYNATRPQSPLFELEKRDLRSSQARGSQDLPFLREYILHKLEELENKLKRVDENLNDSKERQGHLHQQLIELEILNLIEKISKEDTPSEEDVSQLEHLTDQLKIALGIKKDFVGGHDAQ